MGLIANNTIHPIKNDIKPNIKKILKLEYPNTFIVSKSVEFLKFSKNHMLDIKIMKGSNFIIIFGTYKAVRDKGVKIEESTFLKNSISSNKLSIKPKQ
jgi:hypothetical protein